MVEDGAVDDSPMGVVLKVGVRQLLGLRGIQGNGLGSGEDLPATLHLYLNFILWNYGGIYSN